MTCPVADAVAVHEIPHQVPLAPPVIVRPDVRMRTFRLVRRPRAISSQKGRSRGAEPNGIGTCGRTSCANGIGNTAAPSLFSADSRSVTVPSALWAWARRPSSRSATGRNRSLTDVAGASLEPQLEVDAHEPLQALCRGARGPRAHLARPVGRRYLELLRLKAQRQAEQLRHIHLCYAQGRALEGKLERNLEVLDVQAQPVGGRVDINAGSHAARDIGP